MPSKRSRQGQPSKRASGRQHRQNEAPPRAKLPSRAADSQRSSRRPGGSTTTRGSGASSPGPKRAPRREDLREDLGILLTLVAAIAAAVLVSPVWGLVLGTLILVGVYVIYRSLPPLHLSAWRIMPTTTTFIAALLLTSLSMIATNGWQVTHPGIPAKITAACRDVATVEDAWAAFLAPYGEQRRGLPVYSGPGWERLLDALGSLMQAARDTKDASLLESASQLNNKWSSLTGTKLQPNPKMLFISGLDDLDRLYETVPGER
jgi:hypothetical protein